MQSWNFDIKRLFLIIIFHHVIFSSLLLSQSRSELDRKKKENLEHLDNSKKILDKIDQEKTISLNQIYLIQTNIEVRNRLINNLSEEIDNMESDIESNNYEIAALNKRIEFLKEEYAKLIRSSYKFLEKDYALLYIITAQDINQGYLRIKYLRYLTQYRKNVIIEIDSQKMKVENLNNNLKEYKEKSEKLLNDRLSEKKRLDYEKGRKARMVKKLNVKQEEIRIEIQRREKIMLEIESEIIKIIEVEKRKAREGRRVSGLTNEEIILAEEFRNNEGKLPWPTGKGVITGGFGEQNHPILKDIKLPKNRGIDITTEPGSEVKAIFNGVVSKVIAIMGANYTVIIKHGDYYSVYQNLVNVTVKSGDKVKTGGLLGYIYKGADNLSKLHFEMYKEKTILNPEIWLRK